MTPSKEFGEWKEDKCRKCGKHLGYGYVAFHLELCEDCAEGEDT